MGPTTFSGKKNIILCIWKGISSFKMHRIIFSSRQPENSRFTSNFRQDRVTLNTVVFFFIWPKCAVTIILYVLLELSSLHSSICHQ